MSDFNGNKNDFGNVFNGISIVGWLVLGLLGGFVAILYFSPEARVHVAKWLNPPVIEKVKVVPGPTVYVPTPVPPEYNSFQNQGSCPSGATRTAEGRCITVTCDPGPKPRIDAIPRPDGKCGWAYKP